MKLCFRKNQTAGVLLNPALRGDVTDALFSGLGCSAGYDDAVPRDSVWFSDRFERPHAETLAGILSGQLKSIRSVFKLKISERPSKDTTRHRAIDTGRDFAAANGILNNQTAFVLLPDSLRFFQCVIHIRDDLPAQDEVRVPPYLRGSFPASGLILLVPEAILLSRVKLQKASVIDNTTITIEQGLFNRLRQSGASHLELRHLATGASLVRPLSSIRGSSKLEGGEVRLDYFQRAILNVVTKGDVEHSNDRLATIQKKVSRTNAPGSALVTRSEDGKYSVAENYNLIQITPLYEKPAPRKPLRRRMMDWLVGGAEVRVSAVRPYKIDDSRNIVRLSGDTMTLLGIEETDRVIVRFKSLSVKAEAMEIDSLELMKETNILGSEADLDLIAGIPAPIRRQLHIPDIETEITIERDTAFLFFKNMNIQMLAVLGLLLTVFQIGDGHFLAKSIACVILLPVIIFSALSQERSKVRHQQKNRRKNKG